MKILFLDMDGVVNSMQWFEVTSKRAWRKTKGEAKAASREDLVAFGEHMIDPAAVEYLNRIVERTDCKIVMSSSWRNIFALESIRGMLKRAGLAEPAAIIDKTPNEDYWAVEDHPPTPHPYERGYEIDAWMRENLTTKTAFAILDDGSDMAHLRDKLVRTDLLYGITAADAERAIYLLNTEVV